MSMSRKEALYSHGTPETLGVLVTNLGSPDAPTSQAVRRYLAEFLSDPRVIEIPRLAWLPILYGAVLPTRPRRSAHAYQQIWTAQGSPLISISQRLAQLLQQSLEARLQAPVKVSLGMRYGNPSIADALKQLQEANVRRLLVFPLYPQYSAATTASTFDAVAAVFRDVRWLPELRMIMQYHDDAGYITALANSIRESWRIHGHPERLLFSFHGMPRQTLLAGDPYHCHCQKTARLVAEALGLVPDQWVLSFQSRFGRAQWLQPYTSDTLVAWAREGLKRVDVVCPGFSADCLETLEEIAMQNRDLFLAGGGEQCHYIAALNDHADHIQALTTVAMRHLQGWPGTSETGTDRPLAAELDDTRRRALAKGAAR